MDVNTVAVKTKIEAFRTAHAWPIPEDTSEITRKFSPPEDILDRLAQRYESEPVPPCRVCGGELSVQSMGGGNATVYGCSIPEGVTYREHSEHYQNSKWTERRRGDSEVLALVNLLRELAQENN